jgi:hypothetical protein
MRLRSLMWRHQKIKKKRYPVKKIKMMKRHSHLRRLKELDKKKLLKRKG